MTLPQLRVHAIKVQSDGIAVSERDVLAANTSGPGTASGAISKRTAETATSWCRWTKYS